MDKNNSRKNTQTPNLVKPESDEKRLKRLKKLEKLGVKDVTKELEGTFFVRFKLKK